ncbi:ATP12 family chaperone protein [Hyphobacterium sp.]|jgi:chaperone required for assembly of F1-ATPase|uniref:ATP12 family chaperone protein n=1 Tax=Hyphobacterium sp. TaxID=2004662 RepID=UPI003BABB098
MKEGVRLPSREDSLPKRFYKAVSVVETDGGWTVQLDGRGIRTPMKHALVAPTRELAELMAAEWDDQGERIDPFTMPVTRLAHGAIDSATGNRDAIIAEVLKYAGTDLLRHRGEDAELVRRQAEIWNPYLDWAETVLEAKLPAVTGIMPAETTPQAMNALKSKALGYDVWRLTALGQATALTTSAVLGFALVEGRASAEDVFAASRVDEDFQAAHWGEDAEAVARAARLKGECLAIDAMLKAL